MIKKIFKTYFIVYLVIAVIYAAACLLTPVKFDLSLALSGSFSYWACALCYYTGYNIGKSDGIMEVMVHMQRSKYWRVNEMFKKTIGAEDE